MTKIIEFWGAPGSGKSTFAAECFSYACRQGLNCYLVPEFIKPFAIRRDPIENLDQLWIVGGQTQAEKVAYGKYDYIFTDSPVFLPAFYTYYHTGSSMGITGATLKWEKTVYRTYPTQRVRVFLPFREELYNPTGRYETRNQCLDISDRMHEWATEQLGLALHYLPEEDRSGEFIFNTFLKGE